MCRKPHTTYWFGRFAREQPRRHRPCTTDQGANFELTKKKSQQVTGDRHMLNGAGKRNVCAQQHGHRNTHDFCMSWVMSKHEIQKSCVLCLCKCACVLANATKTHGVSVFMHCIPIVRNVSADRAHLPATNWARMQTSQRMLHMGVLSTENISLHYIRHVSLDSTMCAVTFMSDDAHGMCTVPSIHKVSWKWPLATEREAPPTESNASVHCFTMQSWKPMFCCKQPWESSGRAI